MPMNPEYDAVPNTLGQTALDRPGFQVSGYIDKKGTKSTNDTMLNFLPPGQNIDDQENYDGINGSFPLLDLVNPNGYDGWFGKM